MTGELRQFRRRHLSPEDGRKAARIALETPLTERLARANEFFLDDPETLLPLLDSLRNLGPTEPKRVLEESNFLYQFLHRLEPRYPADAFLLDEREYFLGETARIAGTMCRELSLRNEAKHWFDLSEGWFLQTENSSGNLAKLSYQRFALRIEDRDLESVLQLIPQLIASFEKLGMADDGLKARILQGVALKESDRLSEAVELFGSVVHDAELIRNDGILAHALINLAQTYAFMGSANAAIETTRRAAPILQRLDNRIGLAKLEWGIAYLLRGSSDVASAIDAYRSAQQNFAELDMKGDVAAVHLVIADLLLDNQQEKQAEWEIRQALPIIDEYKLVPEGFAAMTLLRESLRRQKIDRQALRNLHGYFEELQG
jgi:tetratricopeptide (TPR) repeat protein